MANQFCSLLQLCHVQSLPEYTHYRQTSHHRMGSSNDPLIPRCFVEVHRFDTGDFQECIGREADTAPATEYVRFIAAKSSPLGRGILC